jgi:hypothetical protein
MFDALDATRICARSSVAPDAWRRPVPVAPARTVRPQPDYSWRSLLRNPHALLVTGMVSTVLVKDAIVRSVVPTRPSGPAPRRAGGSPESHLSVR